MKGFKTQLPYDFAEALTYLINKALVEVPSSDDDDRLLLAGLAEVKHRLYIKMATHRKHYTITFTPVQAIALRILYTDVVTHPPTDYTANRMRQLADEVHRHYSHLN